jgi:tetratricopeptide (TPR) repeat protein
MTRKNNHFFRVFASLALFIGLFLAPLPAVEETKAAKITNFDELKKAIVQVQEQIMATPENAALHLKLAALLLKEGQYDRAEQSLQKALAIEPDHIESLLSLSNLYRRKYEFDRGLQILHGLKPLALENIKVQLLEARYAIDSMDFDQAKAIFQGLLEKDPESVQALYGIAEVYYWEDKYQESEKFIQGCLSLDPEFSSAFLLQSRIHRLRQDNEEWNELGRKAVDLSPFDDEARANLANILFRGERKLQEGYEQTKIALKINPYSLIGHSYLGNGWTPVDYTEQKIEGDEEAIGQIKSLLKKGDENLLKREFAEADAAFGKVLELMPSNLKAMIGKGTLNYHLKEYDKALEWFFKVLDINPDYGLAHYGVSRSLLRKKDKINIKFAEIEKAFAAKDEPEPPFMRDVFINYDQLDPDLQKILRLSVQPLKNYLQTLKEAGSTFYLIPFHKLLFESPHHAGMKGTRTFDLRLWDDVKGCGGIHSTSGEDWEKDAKYLRFNVVTHEFAHQVHAYLTEEQRSEIKRLFQKAKKERRTLDFYANFNEWEYFAVGVEAYVSEEKLADQMLAYGHTRKELLERDPDLYNFIENLGKQESHEAALKSWDQNPGVRARH